MHAEFVALLRDKPPVILFALDLLAIIATDYGLDAHLISSAPQLQGGANRLIIHDWFDKDSIAFFHSVSFSVSCRTGVSARRAFGILDRFGSFRRLIQRIAIRTSCWSAATLALSSGITAFVPGTSELSIADVR
jgi:hypothetical protein